MGFAHTEPVLTSSPCESWFADTEVVVGQLDTVQTVGGTARFGETLIDVTLTPLSSEPRGTVAAITANSVHASAIIQALWRCVPQSQGWSTIIFIDLT